MPYFITVISTQHVQYTVSIVECIQCYSPCWGLLLGKAEQKEFIREKEGRERLTSVLIIITTVMAKVRPYNRLLSNKDTEELLY